MQCLKCKKDIVVGDAKFCPFCGKGVAAAPKPKTKRGNGQGSVYKTPTGWEAQVVKFYITKDDGKRHSRKARKSGFKTKREALDYLPILKGGKEEKIPSLADYWRVWADASLPKLSESKQVAYKIAKEKLEDIFHKPIDTLTIEDLQNAVNDNAPTYYPARDIKTVLSHLYKRAVAQGDVPTKLSDYIELPSLNEAEQHPFTKDEQNSLWERYANADSFAPYVLLMIYTGMMPGELLSARKDMIDWRERKIVGGGKKTKKRKETPIIIPRVAIPILEAICEMSKGEKLIHVSKDSFYKEYYACLERANCRKLPPYSCRHTTGTALGTSEIPLAVVKEIMRHTKITTTQKYIHVDVGTMLEAADKAIENRT